LEGREHDDTVMSLAIAYRCVDSNDSKASFNIVGEDGSEGYAENYIEESEDEEGGKAGQSGSPDVAIGIV